MFNIVWVVNASNKHYKGEIQYEWGKLSIDATFKHVFDYLTTGLTC